MPKSIVDQFWSLERTADRELSKYPVFLQMERQTGLRKTTLIGVSLSAIIGIVLIWTASNLFLVLTMTCYPALMTLAAMEAHDKKEDTQWLSYWLIVSVWSGLEFITGNVLASVIPFYSFLKAAASLWLMLPQTRGATAIYEMVLRPGALKVQQSPIVKDAMKKMQKGATEAQGQVAPKKAAPVPNLAATTPTEFDGKKSPKPIIQD